jgi:hypothetical protein
MKAVFYFADGFAWSYLGDRTSRFTVADWPTARPLRTVLGYSSSIVPVLLSGKLPAESGLWTEYYRHDRNRSLVGHIASRSAAVATPLNMARLVAFRVARQAGWQQAHRLRIPVELSHHFKRHAINYMHMPPCQLAFPTVVDVCAELGLRLSFAFIGDEQAAADALASARREIDNVDVFFFYDCTVDHAGHTYGPDPGMLAPYLDRAAATLEAMHDLVTRRDRLETLLFSDHGMTAVERTFDVFAALRPLRIGRDFLAFPDSTFARFWYPSEHARKNVRGALRDAPGSFLTASEAAQYGVPYPDDRYGEDVLIADEGVVFHPSYISPTFFRRPFPDKGMHGYRPECQSADGVVLYSGKALETELPDRIPAESVFGMMTTVLGAAVP